MLFSLKGIRTKLREIPQEQQRRETNNLKYYRNGHDSHYCICETEIQLGPLKCTNITK